VLERGTRSAGKGYILFHKSGIGRTMFILCWFT
jgi:hypothetical protein